MPPSRDSSGSPLGLAALGGYGDCCGGTEPTFALFVGAAVGVSTELQDRSRVSKTNPIGTLLSAQQRLPFLLRLLDSQSHPSS